MRCDFTYCADKLIETLKDATSILDTRFTTTGNGQRTLTLRFDSAVMPDEGAINTVVRAITSLNDPAYGPARVSQREPALRGRSLR